MRTTATTLFSLALMAFVALGPAQAQIVVDGDLSDADYVQLAAKQNANAGFGASIDVSEIVYYADDVGQTLCFGVKGILDATNSNGIGIWLNFSELFGIAAGNTLGGGGGHYMNSPNFFADFEVDYMLAMNPGTSATENFVDLVEITNGERNNEFLGNTGQSGTPITNGGGVFTAGTVTLAFLSGGGNNGFEMCLPYSELGVTSAGTMEAFTFVVSDTGYFSDVTVPGDSNNGNPGFSANYFTNTQDPGGFGADPGGPIGTGPFHSSAVALPVELTAFAATLDGDVALLTWATASETNNAGFAVEHARAEGDFAPLGFVDGRGTIAEAQTYRFRAADLAPGTHRFRLRQVDFDGVFSFSETVEVTVEMPGAFTLEPAYPNPFNPSATVRFAVREAQPVTVALYNILGQQVRTLFSGIPAAGQTVEARIEAADLPSGLYLIRLTGAGLSATQTVTLMK